jgi:hypothetical protein
LGCIEIAHIALLVPENMNGGSAQAYEQSLAFKREKS